MFDKNIVSLTNQCVGCGCKFTSQENPLKLLSCLHSMCLNCLKGKKPKRRKSISANTTDFLKDNESNGDVPSKEISNGQNSDSDNVKTSADDSVVSKNTAEAENVDLPQIKDKDEKKDDDIKEKLEEQNKSDAVTNSDEGGTDVCEVDKSEKDNSDSNKLPKDDLSDKEDSSSIPPVPGLLKINEEVDEEKKEESNDDKKEKIKEENFLTQDEEEEDEGPLVPITNCPACGDPIEQKPEDIMDNMFAEFDPEKAATPPEDIKHVCMACDEGADAESYCQQCEEWLCDNCVFAHKRVRMTKDHIIIPKDQVPAASSKSPWEHLMTCKIHPNEQLKFFCEKCEQLTCRDCQLLSHKDHKYQFLDQAAEQYKARLKGSLALMGEKRNKLQNNQDEIANKLTNCRAQKDALQQDILKQADVLVKAIRQAVWGVMSNLASFTDAATKRLNKEIEDVKDLVNKFDHCIKFMEDILQEGSSMSLLYSKGNVEAKCRKVYHTQVDPQSLKGNLQIQYRHDVSMLLGNLNKIGSIFVNGVKYPPEKMSNGGPGRQSQKAGYPDPKAMSGTSPHLHHMANQAIPGNPGLQGPDWNLSKFIQTVSAKPGGGPPGAAHGAPPPNMNMGMTHGGGSLPPQLTLPSRRGNQAHQNPGWPQVPPGLGGAGGFVAGQLLTPQQPPPGQNRPAFQPMRLHHRPATVNQFPSEQTGSLRSPPQYRSGGEASGTSRPSSHGTPDPARPASAGMYDHTSQPSLIDVKKERGAGGSSPDCIITSTHLKQSERSAFPSNQQSGVLSNTVLEMQKNLDDVIRAVPINISDNLEEISTPKAPAEVTAADAPTAPAPAAEPTASPASTQPAERERSTSPTAEELRSSWTGGNSMPGFSLAQADQAGNDPNDDYCACCHNGGDVLCCDTCPRVFHLQCHIPELPTVPSGSFICTLCEGDKPVEPEEVTSTGKRKAPGGLPDQDIRVCERILLELFCHPSSVPFQEPVNRIQVPNYYKIITEPVDFTMVKCKLQRRHHNHYASIKAFLHDIRQIFINCAIYNKAGSEVGKAGKIVRALFEELVERLAPQYLVFARENPSPMFAALYSENGENSSGEPSSPKRPKTD